MNSDRITVALLARELGTKLNDVMRLADNVGLHRVRGASTFTRAEADKVRRAFTAERDRRAAQYVRVPAVVPNPSSPNLVSIGSCDCCGLDVTSGPRCSICRDHSFLPGEDAERRDDRLADHRRRLAWAFSPTARELAEYREQTSAALRSRNGWRAVLVEVMVHHEPNDEGCLCGAPHYPCPSVETLERVNPGVARQVQNYLAMPPDKMQQELYNREPWRSTG